MAGGWLALLIIMLTLQTFTILLLSTLLFKMKMYSDGNTIFLAFLFCHNWIVVLLWKINSLSKSNIVVIGIVRSLRFQSLNLCISSQIWQVVHNYILIIQTILKHILCLFMGAIFKIWTTPACLTLNGGAKTFLDQILNQFNWTNKGSKSSLVSSPKLS